MIEPLDLAWAAGFLEGEGCFGWYWHRGRGRNGSLVVSAVQKEREPLDRLRAIFGVGLLNHRVEKGHGAWSWRVNGRAAAPIMEVLLPHMSQRRQQRIRESLTEHAAVQERIAARAIACPQGHLHVEHRGRRANGAVYCKACQREREARRRMDAKHAA